MQDQELTANETEVESMQSEELIWKIEKMQRKVQEH